jgi:thiosulfate/3-mercaptopyruvate sulfurtransferase
MSPITLCTALVLSLAQPPAKAYARPELLIEPADLAKPETAKKFRILDTRSADEFKMGRVPYSSRIDILEWSKRFAANEAVKYWEGVLDRVGVDVDVPVVIVGDDMREVCRAWWILRYWGIKDVRVLNGGWAAWVDGKYPVQTESKGPFFKATTPKLTPAEQRLATKDQLKDSLKDKSLQIIDTRSEAEYCGDTKLAKRGGAIPGAIHLEWKQVLDPKTKRFKSAEELEQLFKKAGIDLTKPSAAHCQSGGRSSVMVFAMELMGANDVRNYYRSWAEWGNAEDTPVVVPKK